MSRWLRFYVERLPPAVLLLTGGGLALSSQVLAWGRLPVSLNQALGAVALSLVFFLELRLMDELKDTKKDKVAHPERPIPRGLITPLEARRGIKLGLTVMIGLGVLAGAFNLPAGLLYLLTALYLWLMFKEFFVGSWLEQRPFLYAISHQVIIIPLCGSLALLATGPLPPEALMAVVRPGILFVGSFFSYEICRKLDPGAHPVLGTYRSEYGLLITGLMLLFTLGILALGLILCQGILGFASSILIACSAALTLVCYIIFARERFKLVEHAATLLLLTTLWLPFLVVAFTPRA